MKTVAISEFTASCLGLLEEVKAIESHISHAYSKLGLSGQGSRAGLVEALGRGAPAR